MDLLGHSRVSGLSSGRPTQRSGLARVRANPSTGVSYAFFRFSCLLQSLPRSVLGKMYHVGIPNSSNDSGAFDPDISC